MLVSGARSCRQCEDAVCRVRGRTCVCVETLGDDKAKNQNELDWLLSMGLMWATDLKTGLKG